MMFLLLFKAKGRLSLLTFFAMVLQKRVQTNRSILNTII